MAPHLLGDVAVVIGIKVDAGADDGSLVDTVLIHLEQELLYGAPRLGVGHLRSIGPVRPSMTVAVDDHDYAGLPNTFSRRTVWFS